MATSEILGQYERATSAATGGVSDRLGTDKETFLKLLVAQLSYQDPLNPVDDTEFIGQLAQFTTVEELQNIRTSVEDMSALISQQQTVQAASLLGAVIAAPGDLISVINEIDYVSAMYIDVPDYAASMTINVYTTYADGTPGKLVYSVSHSNVAAGEDYPFYWDGKDSDGNEVADGTYYVTVNAMNSSGRNVICSTRSTGQVGSVEKTSDGDYNLYLTDGRKVRYADVELVTYVAGSSGDGTGTGDGDGDDGATGDGDDGDQGTEG